MRRSEIIVGTQQILEAINHSKIMEAIRMALRRDQAEGRTQLAASIQTYFRISQSFNSAAKEIETIFELHILENPQFWSLALGESDSPERDTIVRSLYSNLLFAQKQIPRIIKLLDREYLDSAKENEPIISNGKEMKLISVMVFENDKRLSSPQRLINVLESVNTFYTVCAYIHDESPDTLSVVGCDSGSDKSFDFLGVAKVIECVTQLIEHMWDRVVFYREKQLEVRLDLINKSLPIYEKLNELEAGKKIEPELAGRLRRNISEGVNKFIESGASIPEIDAHSTYNSRSLLSPVQKLLVSAPEELEETSQQRIETQTAVFDVAPYNDDEIEIENLSSDEQKILTQLLKKMKNSSVTQADDAENLKDDIKSIEDTD